MFWLELKHILANASYLKGHHNLHSALRPTDKVGGWRNISVLWLYNTKMSN